MKIYSLIVFALLFNAPILIHAQNITLKRFIKWNPSKIVSSNPNNPSESRTLTLFGFDKAVYANHSDFLPYYNEVLRTDSIGFSNVVSKVEVMQSQTCTTDEIKQLSINKSISDKITFKFSLQKIKKTDYLSVQILPFVKDAVTGEFKKVTSFQIKFSKTPTLKGAPMRSYASHSVLSSGKWYKIKITQDGMYSLTFDELKNLGFSTPANVRVFGNGGGMLPEYNNVPIFDDLKETQVLIKNNTLFFYAKGTHRWYYDPTKGMVLCQVNIYSKYAYYFLTDQNSGVSNQVPIDNPPASVDQVVKNYLYAASHERQDTNILHSGQKWFGEILMPNSRKSFGFQIPNVQTGTIGKMDLNFIGHSQSNDSYQVAIENINQTFPLYSVDFGGLGDMYSSDEQVLKYNQTTNNPSVTLTYISNSYDSNGWLDNITLNASCSLQKNDSILRLNFIDNNANGSNTRFSVNASNGSVHVWNINSYPNIKESTVTPTASGFQFDARTQKQWNQFVVFSESDPMFKPILSGADVGAVQNQDLHGLTIPDMVIVTHPNFLDQAKEIEKIHKDHDQLKVVTVTTDLIYNEFSSGAKDVSAIKNFVKMFYDRAGSPEQAPRYLLLVGDGSYDNLNDNAYNSNFIPTYESPESANRIDSYVSDDYFGMLDDTEGATEGLLDIGIGRLPVKSPAEASTMVKKLTTYLDPSSMGDWRNYLCFIGDNGDYNLHSSDADKLSTLVQSLQPGFNHEKIYLDAFPEVAVIGGRLAPDANTALANRINKGALVVNYSGHGNEVQLSALKIITRSDILSWNNPTKLPIFMTATCEFSQYDDYHLVTGGETLVLRPDGGAIAMYATTRLVFESENFRLNTSFYNYLFTSNNNGRLALGDVMSLTKNSLGESNNKLNFTLLGDPAIQLVYPQNKVSITSIDGKNPNSQLDTVKALNKLNIKGIVLSNKNQKDPNFNGTVSVTVYDKPETVTTLNNLGQGVLSYQSQNSILYKGKATASNGDFSIEFIIPRDINYSYGNGKISAYANDFQVDAAGYSKNIVIGGISNQASNDKKGPEIKIYLNDSSFVFGGIATPNSKLIATLKDESGINTAGRGIGHDITLVLDGNTSKEIVLNDFYTASLNSYKSGKLEYYFNNLSIGSHNLRLKAWDVNNNSTEAYLEFYVSDVSNLMIDHVLNYPNPFTNHTDFYFEHNQPGRLLNAQVQIYTVTGKLIKTLNSSFTTQGSRSEPISWDGRDDFGDAIGRGVYIYKLKVACDGFASVYKIEKLLILR